MCVYTPEGSFVSFLIFYQKINKDELPTVYKLVWKSVFLVQFALADSNGHFANDVTSLGRVGIHNCGFSIELAGRRLSNIPYSSMTSFVSGP